MAETQAEKQAALAALAYAIANEQDGHYYYTVVAEHVKDPKGRAIFRALARDELEHYRILAAQYQSVQSNGKWLPLERAKSARVPQIDEFVVRLEDLAGVPQERLFPSPQVVVPALDAGTGDIAAIDHALSAEKRGYDIYRRARDNATDPLAKEAYAVLMSEESRHFEWLQRSRDYLANTSTYWDDTERPFFEG